MRNPLVMIYIVLFLWGCGKSDGNGATTDKLGRKSAECADIIYDPISIHIVQSSGIVKIYPDPSKGPGNAVKIVQSSAIVKVGVNPRQSVTLKIIQSSAIVITEGVCLTQ